LRGRSHYQPEGTSASSRVYAQVFVRRVHALIALGYALLNPSDFALAEEEDITGELVDSVQAVLDNPNGPDWADWFFVHEEPREHDLVRKGKKRKRLDIRIDSSESRPRDRLRFEAKRLDPNHGASAYLGSDGIQRFTDGRYAAKDPIAGMLGYVQAGAAADWAQKIEQAITKDATKFGLRKSSPWRAEQLARELQFTYCSGHDRLTVGQPIEIFHTLLIFN
jgi:hypothetical protein